MDGERGDTWEITEASFGSIAALVADAKGNALVMPDRVRIHFGAEYLRLAARKSAALAELLDAVSTSNQRSGDRAKKRILAVDRDIEKFLGVVERDGARMLKEHGGQVVQLTGDQASEFLEAVRNGTEIPKRLFEPEPAATCDDSADELGDTSPPGNTDTAPEEPTHVGQDIRAETVVPIEVGAYQAWCEMTDLAYKKDGMRGVVQVVVEAALRTDEIANVVEEEAPGCENLQRATIFQQLWLDYLPQVSKELAKLPDGPYFWEDVDGNAVDSPQPGQRLRTAAETRARMQKLIAGFETYQAAGGRALPGFFRELMTQ